MSRCVKTQNVHASFSVEFCILLIYVHVHGICYLYYVYNNVLDILWGMNSNNAHPHQSETGTITVDNNVYAQHTLDGDAA